MRRFNNKGNTLMLGLGILSLVFILAAVGGYFYLKSTTKIADNTISPITTPVGNTNSYPANQPTSQSAGTGTTPQISTVADLDKLSTELDAANLDVASDITQ